MIDLVCVEKWLVMCQLSAAKKADQTCKSLFSADLNSANLGLVRFYQTALCKSFFRTNASQDLNSAVLKYFLDTFPHYSRTYYAIFVYLLNHQYLKCCISPHVVLKIFHVWAEHSLISEFLGRQKKNSL